MILTKPIIASSECLKGASNHRRAFSLVEVLIAVTLMSVIVLGLMAMFSQTQRAFRMGITQVDVMESGRAALEMMAREMEQAQATGLRDGLNFQVGSDPAYELRQSLPGSAATRTNIFQSVRFAVREGQEWTGIGYAVLYSNAIGTLYRFETNTHQVPVPPGNVILGVDQLVASVDHPRRVIDGVVSLRVHTYDKYGQLISPNYGGSLPIGQFDITWGTHADDIACRFLSNALPAYVEIELGILEAKTAERARNMENFTVQTNFLAKQVGHVQVFRQRVPIRNIDPSVYQ